MDANDVRALLKLAIELADHRRDADSAVRVLLDRLRDLTGAASATIARANSNGDLHDVRSSGQRSAADVSLLVKVVEGARRNYWPIVHPVTRVARQALCSALRIDEGVSIITLHRSRTGRRRWGSREVTLLDLLHPEIAWLHTPPPSGPEITADLSPRQRQTLHLLLCGLSEKQIAANLKLSVHTVHVYVKAVYRAYHIASRAELLAMWVRH